MSNAYESNKTISLKHEIEECKKSNSILNYLNQLKTQALTRTSESSEENELTPPVCRNEVFGFTQGFRTGDQVNTGMQNSDGFDSGPGC
jgi:hypothetical protein